VRRLDGEAIERELSRLGASFGRPLAVAAETASTNDDARSAAAAGAPHGAAFLADAQTQGRGRGGRSWHSPPGENLYLSVVLRPRLPASRVAPIALVMGLAVASVIERRLAPLPSRGASGGGSAVEVRLKWPNDVLIGNRKLGGILIELRAEAAGPACVVVGIGLNVALGNELIETIAATGLKATDLVTVTGRTVPRNALAAQLIENNVRGLLLFEQEGLKPFIDQWRNADALRGRPLDVSVGNEVVRGLGRGIDLSGALLVETRDGLQKFLSGEVTVRPAE